MQRELGHLSDVAGVLDGNASPTHHRGMVTMDLLRDFGHAASRSNDLSNLHVVNVGPSHLWRQAVMWGEPAFFVWGNATLPI